MCLAQGHNTVAPVGIEPRTQDLSIRSPTLYHYATTLTPSYISDKVFVTQNLMLIPFDKLKVHLILTEPIETARIVTRV